MSGCRRAALRPHGRGLRAEPAATPPPRTTTLLAPQGVEPADAGVLGLAQRSVQRRQLRPQRLPLRRVQPALQRREALLQLAPPPLQLARLDLFDRERLFFRVRPPAPRFVHVLDRRAGRRLVAVVAVVALFLAALRLGGAGGFFGFAAKSSSQMNASKSNCAACTHAWSGSFSWSRT